MLAELRDVSVTYGAVRALESVTFGLRSGEMVVLFGPNGAGKSTILKALFGLVPVRGGAVYLDDVDITRLRADERVHRGISYVPEYRRLFPALSVAENLGIALHPKSGREVRERVEAVLSLFPSLRAKAKLRAGVLSTGEQQLVALARALIQRPRLILADEPSLGVSPAYADIIFDQLAAASAAGAGVLVVEQNARMALELAHRGYVCAGGRIVLDGSASDLLTHPRLKQLFLGGSS